MTAPVRILLVSGSTRGASTNTAVLRTARDVAPAHVAAVLYDGLAVLPAFNPDDESDPGAAVAALRRQIAECDAVLFCTPEYAGGLPGSFKNLLDWTVGGGELYGKPVAWLNVAAAGRGEGAQTSLETVLGYVGAAAIESACVRLPVGREAVGSDGVIADEAIRARLADVVQEMLRYLGQTGQ
jgi:chromate reductase